MGKGLIIESFKWLARVSVVDDDEDGGYEATYRASKDTLSKLFGVSGSSQSLKVSELDNRQ